MGIRLGIDYNLEQFGEVDKLFHEQHTVGNGREDAIPVVATACPAVSDLDVIGGAVCGLRFYEEKCGATL